MDVKSKKRSEIRFNGRCLSTVRFVCNDEIPFKGSYSTISSGHGIIVIPGTGGEGSKDPFLSYLSWMAYQYEGYFTSSPTYTSHVAGLALTGHTYFNYLPLAMTVTTVVAQRPALQ